MANFKRPASPDRSRRDGGDVENEASTSDKNPEVEADTLSAIQAHYAARCSPAANTDTSAIRLLNNYVKSCILDVSVRAGGPVLSVADIACGRGQDFPKWSHAFISTGCRLETFYAMDAADTREHVRSMVQKYIEPLTHTVVTCMGDMSKRFEGLADESVDIVSCQLCLHYLCDDVLRLEAFFAECRRVMRRHGVLLVSYADGRSIVRRGRDALTARPAPGYTVAVHGQSYSFHIPSEHLAARIASPFGCKYTFSLADSVVALPEFLCHEGSVCAVAARAGYHAGTSMSFDDAVRVLRKKDYYKKIAEKMKCIDIQDTAAFDAANLYRFTVFSQSRTALNGWRAVLDGSSVAEPGTTARRCQSSSTTTPPFSHKKPKL